MDIPELTNCPNATLKNRLFEAGFGAEIYDFDNEVAKFQQAMELGLNEPDTHIRMLPTWVSVPDQVPANNRVLVIDLGGTNLRVGKVYFDEGCTAVIEDVRKEKIPGLRETVFYADVFDKIAEMSEDWLEDTSSIGFCFSFPFRILDNGDAKVLFFGKELHVEGMVGKIIGDEMHAAWERFGRKCDLPITVLNDTVSTLLMGKLNYPKRPVSGFIGFILGTGMNASYVEQNESIRKLNDSAKTGSQIVNTECGDYRGFQQSKYDQMLDAESKNPEVFLAEKMMSGAYLGRLTELAVRDVLPGLDYSAFDNSPLGTKELNDFLVGVDPEHNRLRALANTDEETEEALFFIIDQVLERTAKLAAIVVASAVIKEGASGEFGRPFVISIDGSTYRADYFLKERIEDYLRAYLLDIKNIHFQILLPEDASLLGASIAAISK